MTSHTGVTREVQSADGSRYLLAVGFTVKCQERNSLLNGTKDLRSRRGWLGTAHANACRAEDLSYKRRGRRHSGATGNLSDTNGRRLMLGWYIFRRDRSGVRRP
jgi:hypothetical protein